MARRRKKKFELSVPLNHLALIMDGNGRWAKRRLLPRNEGHRRGARVIFDIAEACVDLNIPVVSLYAFSTENWSRPQEELDFLFSHLEEEFRNRRDELIENDIKIIVMGDITRLPQSTQDVVNEIIELTKNNKSLIVNFGLNYGARDEITRAASMLASDYKEGKLEKEAINNKTFAKYLYTAGLPEVDLLIRTSGEERLSNFMLWQVAYAEFIFTKTYWPDFNKKRLIKCLKQFEKRNRRYGGL